MLNEATIFKGAFWSSLGFVFERAMFFLLPVFIAPLGPASLGIFYLSLRIFNTIIAFPVTALNIHYVYKLRHYLEDQKSMQFEEEAAVLLKVYFMAGMLLGIFFFTVIALFSPLKALLFLALAIPFAIINSYMMLLLRLLQRFNRVLIIQMVLMFGFQLTYLLIFIRLFNMGIAAAFFGQLLMNVLISIAATFFLFNRLNLLGFFRKIALKMYLLSPLSFANVLFITLFPIGDIVVVALLFGFSALGHYIILLYLPLIIRIIPPTLFSMFIHVAAVKTRASEDITVVSKQVFKWILIMTTPLFIIIMLYPEFLLSFLFHKSLVTDLNITRLLAVSFFIQSISWTAGRILLAKNKRLSFVLSNYLLGLMFIILSLILGPTLGLLGIAISYLIFSILDALVKYVLTVILAKVNLLG